MRKCCGSDFSRRKPGARASPGRNRWTRRSRSAGSKRENKSGIYSYEQRPVALPEPYRSALAAHPRAAGFFEAQPPSYRKLVTWWVVSAKKEETRQSRLDKLVAACDAGKRL